MTWVNDPSTGQRSRRADSYRLAKKRSAQGIAQLFRPQLFEVLRAPPKVAAKIPESVPSTQSDRSGRLSQDGLALAVSREARKGRQDVLRGRRELDTPQLLQRRFSGDIAALNFGHDWQAGFEVKAACQIIRVQPLRQKELQAMNKSHQSIAAIAVVAALGVASPANAQQHAAALGDLMTAFVQPRHIKLGLAGSEQNWPYAAYELDQLRETLADVAEILPKYRDLSIPDMITSTVKEPLAALNRAIQARDGNQFSAAYGQLTASCNACHQSYDRAAIVIRPPTVAAFPDQDFRPLSK